jgi:hypothetical protein
VWLASVGRGTVRVWMGVRFEGEGLGFEVILVEGGALAELSAILLAVHHLLAIHPHEDTIVSCDLEEKVHWARRLDVHKR